MAKRKVFVAVVLVVILPIAFERVKLKKDHRVIIMNEAMQEEQKVPEEQLLPTDDSISILLLKELFVKAMGLSGDEARHLRFDTVSFVLGNSARHMSTR
jgi:hypothetical protein